METSLDKIKECCKDKIFTGYIWMVEEAKPCVYKNEKVYFDQLNKTENSFNKIQEANLRGDNFSIHIKTIDGNERCFVHQDTEIKDKFIVDKEIEYPTVRKKLSGETEFPNSLFRQVYQLTADEISEGFSTYRPVFKQFMGFKKT